MLTIKYKLWHVAVKISYFNNQFVVYMCGIQILYSLYSLKALQSNSLYSQ